VIRTDRAPAAPPALSQGIRHGRAEDSRGIDGKTPDDHAGVIRPAARTRPGGRVDASP
jgi:hypothetical protein